LNNQFLLTQGAGASSRGALLSPLSAFTGIHTFISKQQKNSHPMFFQAFHPAGSPLAHCLFLAPANSLESPALPDLLDGLTKQIGGRGAFNLVAEVEEEHPAFTALRQNGFGIFARQRMWKVTQASNSSGAGSWRPVLERDRFGIHLLRKALVPGQVQQIEMEHSDTHEGYVFRHDREIVAYAEVRRGPRGIWVLPFIHLDAEPFDKAIADLLARLRPRSNRPVYICLRSYQDWLQVALEDLNAQAGPRQVVMARRTSLAVKVEETRRSTVAARNAEPATMQLPEPQAHFSEHSVVNKR
ncbi:MAG: hypothetical protein WD740_06520, partial [Anaerolineales bacterium]